MQLKHEDGTGGVAAATSSQPLAQTLPLLSMAGPTYVTGQLLVQQVAFLLSDKIFSYSPDTFDLDSAAKTWSSQKEHNIHHQAATVVPLQTRLGAGAFVLGYIFSDDFDVATRHIPQSLLAASLSLPLLRSALDHVSLLYEASSPFVGHIAAAHYSVDDGLVTDYVTALQLAEDLGMGLVSSSSAYEAQHMALFATLMAAVLPTLHLYDGLWTSRETLRVVDVLSKVGIADIYNRLAHDIEFLNKRLDGAGKILELMRLFNNELGTAYEPFEYCGHEAPETVLVVFGSVESQIVKRLVSGLAQAGSKIGAINVRLFRPLVEEALMAKLPTSVQEIVVLGQVGDHVSVNDDSVHSVLYTDVRAATAFYGKWPKEPSVVQVKYQTSTAHTPDSILSLIRKAIGQDDLADAAAHAVHALDQYTFWDVDNSNVANAPAVVGTLLTRESTSNVYLHKSHDNLIQGGIVRTDIRSSKKSIEASYAVQQADVTLVGHAKLLGEVAIVDGVKTGGKLILRLPGCQPGEVPKRIPATVLKQLRDKEASLFVLNTSSSPALEHEAQRLVELAFLRVARPEIGVAQLIKLGYGSRDLASLQECVDALETCLDSIHIPTSVWAETEVHKNKECVPKAFQCNSFVALDTQDPEQALHLHDWQSAAKGLAFKEAYGTHTSLRPDLAVTTHTIRVTETRRLTPPAYDRNILHIEFDLGDSGLTYAIGEALGIHADNDPEQVLAFVQWYGLEADRVLQVPSREDANLCDTRTVFQSMVQNMDIFGKPPQRFFASLAVFATDEAERKKLEYLGAKEGADEFRQLVEADTVTYADVLQAFPSARPSFPDLARIIAPLDRREYSIASAQAVTPRTLALMIVVVDWVDTQGRTRFGQATRYLSSLTPGAAVVASVKASVMKLPAIDTAPLVMAGLGTGLAPFRAFVQYRAMQKAQGKDIGAILLYLGSRHQREEYLYGEEWEAYLAAGVLTLLGAAFSRDQPQKIYIQDRMRQTMPDLVNAIVTQKGSFYLCGPTWPVADVTQVLKEAIAYEAHERGKTVNPTTAIEKLKDEGRYVLEVY